VESRADAAHSRQKRDPKLVLGPLGLTFPDQTLPELTDVIVVGKTVWLSKVHGPLREAESARVRHTLGRFACCLIHFALGDQRIEGRKGV
jgi:hypothetical protein